METGTTVAGQTIIVVTRRDITTLGITLLLFVKLTRISIRPSVFTLLHCRCYVGNLSKEQWRPCNDRYQPYQGHKRDAPHWPISYVHRQGPPNNTAHYEHESVVDNFLDSLQFNKERLIGNNSWSGDMLEPFINGTVSPLPEFQVSKSRQVSSQARLCFIDLHSQSQKVNNFFFS